MRFIIILFALFSSLSAFAQALLFSKSFVDLNGGQSVTNIHKDNTQLTTRNT